MSRVDRYLVDPNEPQSIVEQMEKIHQVVDGDIGFGFPNEEAAPTSSTAAGAAPTNHNGYVENIVGSWVEATFTAADTAVTCYHNLFPDPEYNLPVTGEPNVRWLVFGFSHDGTGANAASTLSVSFHETDTVAVNSIELRCYVGGGRTIHADNPVTVTLFFVPAVRALLETAP